MSRVLTLHRNCSTTTEVLKQCNVARGYSSLLLASIAVPITSGSSFPPYCIPFSRKRPPAYLSAYAPTAEWYTPAGVPYPKSMKLEPMGYCYQEEMMTPAISMHSQPQVYTTQDLYTSQQYVYPSLQTTHFCTGPSAVDSNFAATSWSTAQPTTSSVSPSFTSMTYDGTVSMNSSASTTSPTPSPCEDNSTNNSLTNPLTPPTSGGISPSHQVAYAKQDNAALHQSPSSSPASDCPEPVSSANFPTLPIQSLSGSIHLPGVLPYYPA